MNTPEEKLIEYLEKEFWDAKINFATAEGVLNEVLGNGQTCNSDITDLIERCLKITKRPTVGIYYQEVAKLKEAFCKKSSEKASCDSSFISDKVRSADSMSVRSVASGRSLPKYEEQKEELNFDFMELDLVEHERVLLTYLKDSFWDQKTDYQSAADIINAKLANSEPENLHPAIEKFMDSLIKTPNRFGPEDSEEAEERYLQNLHSLINDTKRLLILPENTKRTQNMQLPFREDSQTSSIQQNIKPLPQKVLARDSNEVRKDATFLHQVNAQIVSEQARKVEQKTRTLSKEVEFLVEYREIDITELKDLIVDFIDTFTRRELTLPFEGMQKYCLVEKIHVNDELGLWSYDHFQGCMNIWLKSKTGVLPKKLRIENGFSIRYVNTDQSVSQVGKQQLDKVTVTLESFLIDVAEANQKDKSHAEKWLQTLKKGYVDKLDEILAWDEKDWDHSHMEVNAIKLIRNHLNQFRFKSNQTSDFQNLTRSEKCAVTHRIRRFLVWKIKSPKELEKIEYLDERALQLGFEEIREKYVGEHLLNQLETFYESFTIPKSYSKSLILNRGMLLYGPPGTGKTVLTDILPSRIGLTPISYPLCASEVNRSLVGQTEKLLLELVSRAEKIPYLLCCLAVDEIDGLAPKRDEKSSQGKIDALAVLLSVIGGIKDVKNLMFLASTNRLNQMDDAFKRRMSGQFFVGRPSPIARKKIIESSEGTNLSDKMIDQVVLLSTNFSGAALKQYISYIVSETRKLNSGKDGKEGLSYHVLAEIAAKTSKQFNIRLGNYSLPELFLLQKQKENPLTTSFLKSLEDKQAIFIVKKNLLEIVYRHFRMEDKPTYPNKKPMKIAEIERQNIIVEDASSNIKQLIENLENLMPESGKNGEKKQRIEVAAIKFGQTEPTEGYLDSLLEKHVSELEKKARDDPKTHFVLMWPDFIDLSQKQKENRNLPMYIQSWFKKNAERIFSVENLYHFFITSESNCEQLYPKINWQTSKTLDKKKIKFTGRILIDLSEDDPELRFELDADEDDDTLHSESLMIRNKAANSFQVIPKLVEFASQRGIDFILLMDQDFLLANNAFDESKIKENITEKMQEFNCYEKSLLIVDVDSLAGMTKSVSESSMGGSTSYNLSDSKVYSMIIHYARSLPKILQNSEYWVALISKNKELSNMIKHDLSWPLTNEEMRMAEEEEMNQRPRECLRCSESYVESKNEFNSCTYHDGELFEVSAKPFEWRLVDEEKAKELFLNRTVNNKYQAQGNNQNKETQFLYICCLQPLKSPGCKKQKHTNEKQIIKAEQKAVFEKYIKKLEGYKKTCHIQSKE